MTFKATPLRLSTAQSGFEDAFKARLHWSADTDAQVEDRVTEILADVRKRGDAAVLDYTNRFDALAATAVPQLELTQAELKAAFDGLPAVQRDALGRQQVLHAQDASVHPQDYTGNRVNGA